MRKRPIVVTDTDERRLRRLLERASLHDQAHLKELQSELERAVILSAQDVPGKVITMHSKVRVLDLERGQRTEFTLVFPNEADVESKRISVLAPLGTALLGFQQGDCVEWLMPGGARRLSIERVRQPSMDGGQGAARMRFRAGALAPASP